MTYAHLVESDTSPYADITFPADITGNTGVAVSYRINAADVQTLPEGQVSVIDTGATDGTARVRVTFETDNLYAAGLMYVDVAVTLPGGRVQHVEEPVVLSVREVLADLVPE